MDASGDQGGGNARRCATRLTSERLTEVVKCGRPGSGMPYHDRFAYTDKRCYGHTREEMATHAAGEHDFYLNARSTPWSSICLPKQSAGASNLRRCVDFWGKDTRQCDPMKN
jgi:hypothetical protein